jgi:hypothetical protein
MNEQHNRNLPVQEESVEIELNAEELRNLSRPRNSPLRAEPVRRSARSTLIAGATSAAIVAACAGVWALNADAPQEVAPPPPVAMAAVEAPVAAVPAAPEAPPVRIRNPFDKGEVFEFPPGTSAEEARAAVADALMQRAMERQALLDVRPTKRKRAG